MTPNITYTFSAYLRGPTAINGWALVAFYDSGGVQIAGSVFNGSAVPINPTTWTRVSVSAVAPANAVSVLTNAGRWNGTVSIGDVLDMDAVLVEAAPSASAYFDGSTPRVGMTDYAWTGTAHASTSVKRVAYQSNRLLSTYPIVSGSGYYEIANGTGTSTLLPNPLQRGVTYRASVLVYVDPANPITAGYITGFNYSESGTSSNNSGDTLPVGFFGERQLSLTFTPSTDVAATSWRLRAYNGHVEGALNVWYDNFIVEENPPIDSLPLELGRNYLQNSSLWADTVGWLASAAGGRHRSGRRCLPYRTRLAVHHTH